MKLEMLKRFTFLIYKVLAFLLLSGPLTVIPKTIFLKPDIESEFDSSFNGSQKILPKSQAVEEAILTEELGEVLKSRGEEDLNDIRSIYNGIRNINQHILNLPDDGNCTYEICQRICHVIYLYVRKFYAQCLGKYCFCFRKDELFPTSIREFLKKATLFGIPQQYD